MNILSIGNSFSEDAHYWLPAICKNSGHDANIVNLYIGGCSLDIHDRLLKSKEEKYAYQKNGNNKDCPMVSSYSVLSECNWDIITIQQASHYSGRPQSYFPFLETLSDQIHEACPQAKLYIQQTWPYGPMSTHHNFPDYNCDRWEMYRRLSDCYLMASHLINAPLIPVADCLILLSKKMPEFSDDKADLLYRDGFHLSYTYGRFFASLIWYSVIFNGDIRKISISPPDADLTIINKAKELLASELESSLS